MIFGRDAEIGAVERFLDRVATTGGALVVDGEAGIGKTTIWREALHRAEQREFRVLVARPAEAEAALSYAALADLVAAPYAEVGPELPLPQRRAFDMALLSSEEDGESDARTTAVGLLGILSALAVQRPVVVAVDDVQWLDRASQRALEYAARRLPPHVGILAARRSVGGDAPLGLASALPDEWIERVVLGPLSAAALHHLIRSGLGVAPTRPVLVRIESASGGNPFYALEIARMLTKDGNEPGPGERLPIPDNLQELVTARTSALSARAQEAALVAAALSRPTVATVVAALGSQDEAEASIVEAEEAGIIVAERARIRFSHPLLASAVYSAASHERRRQLHRHLAEVVSDAEERARHLAESATQADAATAAEIERAAELAARRGAQDAAAQLYDAAARLTPEESRDDVARRMLGEAAALFAAGDPTGAREVAEAALASAVAVTLRAEANVLLGDIAWVENPGRLQIDHLERALGLADGDRRLCGRIHAKLIQASLSFDQRKALEHAEAAAALLDENEDPALLAHVLFDELFFGAQLGRKAPRGLLERALRLEERAGPNEQRSRMPLMWFAWMDELEAARARHAFEAGWYRDRGEEGWRAERLGQLASVELTAGNWETAERMIEESCTTLDQMGLRVGPWGMIWSIRGAVDLHRGRIDRARETLLALAENSERTGHHFFAAVALSRLGSVELAAADAEAADRAFVRYRGHLDTIGVVAAPGPRHDADHVEALVELGDLERATAALQHLEWRGRTIPRPWITVALPRARALVLAAGGDADGALAELVELDAEAAARVPSEHGRTLLVKGRLQRRLKQKAAAAETLHEAVAILERSGATIWTERARRELERIGLRRAPDELTVSERRVAELAATGLTNREVALAAFMSPKTVEANLSRVYRKLGITSRAELGARMAAEGEGGAGAQT